MVELTSVDIALSHILKHTRETGDEMVSISRSLGRVLAKDIYASEDLPPFPNSSMDGYAVRAADIAQASPNNPIKLKVVMDIPAGHAPERPIKSGEAARIMTGAPMPEGADAVVPVEDTDSDWQKQILTPLPEQVTIYRAVDAGAYVRQIGENVKKGDFVLPKGRKLKPQDIGMLASLGIAKVPVKRQPKVAIISTGDELVDVDEPLSAGKIRNSNSYALAGMVTEAGGEAIVLPKATDTLDAVRKVFQQAIAIKPDIVLSSAGVSVGAADLIRTVIDELGKVDMWRVNLRPGKPLAYGQVGGHMFFGLPGNPVSAMVTFDVFVRPTLLKIQGREDNAVYAIAYTEEAITSDGRRSYLRVKLRRDEQGKLWATTTGTQSSGALMSMVLADGLLIVPEDVKYVAEGSPLQVRLLRMV